MTIFRDIQVLAREWKKFRGKTRLCLILPIFILILKKIPQECPVPPCISASLAPGLPVSGLPCPEAGQRQHRAQRAAAGPRGPSHLTQPLRAWRSRDVQPGGCWAYPWDQKQAKPRAAPTAAVLTIRGCFPPLVLFEDSLPEPQELLPPQPPSHSAS